MKKCLFTAASFLVLTACGPSIKVSHDYDENTNVSNYKTYSWLTLESIEAKGVNPVFYNELNDARIKDAVNKEMQARGFVLAEGKTDLELHYHIIVENKTSETIEPNDYSYPTTWKKVSTYNYKEGTLIIDLMDTKKSSLIWRGNATGVITYQTTAKPAEAINYAVSKIFKTLPQSAL